MNKVYMYILCSVIIICFLFTSYFYREEPLLLRVSNNDTLYAPSYGTLKQIIYNDKKNTLFLAFFLSPLDIHYQYIPINGLFLNTIYDATGKYNLAFQLNKSNDNEKAIHYIKTQHGIITIYQICGFLTRRIRYDIKPNQSVISGQRLGIIKLGSRVDIIIPNARSFMLKVKLDESVYGSNSKIGYWN
jgi:phosphatidylserine decarboxylase